MPEPRLDLPARLWTLRKDPRTATCDVVAHPIGLEARYAVDGDLVRSQAFRELPALKNPANARLALEAVGP